MTIADTSPVYNEALGYIYPRGNRFKRTYSKIPGKNQYAGMRSLKELQKIIDEAPLLKINGKFFEQNKKDLTGLSEYSSKELITDKEARKYGKKLKYKSSGKKRIEEVNQGNIKRRKKIDAAQGSEIPIRGGKILGKNFGHVYPIIESAKPGTKTTTVIDAKMNSKLTGFNTIGQTIAEEQEWLIKNKPQNYKTEIEILNGKARVNVRNAIGALGPEYKGQIGYFQVNPETGEFKPKAGNYKNSFAGIEGENKIYKDMTSSERSQFSKTISKAEFDKAPIEIKNIFNKGNYNIQKNTAVALGCPILKAEGGRIGYALGTATINCVNTKLTNEPVQSSMKLRVTEGIGKIKPAATSFLKLLGRAGTKAAPLAALAAVGAGIEPLVKQFVADDPSTYLTNENQMKGMLLATIEGETPKVDEEILKWQMPALGAATAAGAIPGAGELYKTRRGVGPTGPLPGGVGKARAALGISGVLGKALGATFSPLAGAATLPLTVAAQRKGGTEWGDIATDPMNWMTPAFASAGAEMATKGMKPTGIMAQAIRLGMSPRTLRLVSSRLGWPGLAVSAGMWGYDKWKNRSINDEE